MKTPLLSNLRKLAFLAQKSHFKPGSDPIDEYLADEAARASRRRFLRRGMQAGAVALWGGADAFSGILAPDARKKYRIAIVGAGMAGLSAAYHLRRKGVEATVFEGDKRAGGRIKSARIFANGALNTEIGAEFIDTFHQDMLWFVKALGFQDKLIDVEKDLFGQRDAFYIDTRHYTAADAIAELKEAYPRIVADSKKLDDRYAETLDRMSMAEYIEGMPLSAWMKKMLHAAYIGENGLDTAEQSAANMLSVFEIRGEKFLPFGNSDERFKVIGGNEQIPQKLAQALSGQIRYEHRLTALRENADDSLTLVFSENGTTREERFDIVLMTLPFTILRDIDIQMTLPETKKRVIRELGYGTNSKFILETHTRPWRTAGYRGYLFNERIHNGWDSAQMQNNNEGMGAFTCYLGAEQGKNAAKGKETELLAYAMPALEGAFAGAKASLSGKMELANWPSNPFIKGSYSCFKPGQTSAFSGAARQPVRNLYFAGEHCSDEYWGFMNGAAETGRVAAEKLLRKMRIR